MQIGNPAGCYKWHLMLDQLPAGQTECGCRHFECLEGEGEIRKFATIVFDSANAVSKAIKGGIKGGFFKRIRSELNIAEYAKSVFAVGIALSRLKRSQTCGCSFSLQLKNCRR